MWELKEVKEEEFYNKVRNSDKPVFIDFWAIWCAPCRMMEPLLNQVMNEYKDKIEFIKLNVDINKKIASEYNIQGVPSYMIIKGKDKLREIVGAASKKMLSDMIDSVIKEIGEKD